MRNLFIEAVGLPLSAPLGASLALLLYHFGGPALGLGFLYGVAIGLLDLWLMFLGLLRLMRLRSGARPLAQWLVVQSYLGRMLLLGLLLWFSLRCTALDFFAAAGGLLLPRLVLFLKHGWDRRWAGT